MKVHTDLHFLGESTHFEEPELDDVGCISNSSTGSSRFLALSLLETKNKCLAPATVQDKDLQSRNSCF